MAFYITPSGVHKIATGEEERAEACVNTVSSNVTLIIDTLTNQWASENASALSLEVGSSVRSMYDWACNATHEINSYISDIIFDYNQKEGNYCPPLAITVYPYDNNELDNGTPKTLPDGESYGVAEGNTATNVGDTLNEYFTRICEAYKMYMDGVVEEINNSGAFDSATVSHCSEIARRASTAFDSELTNCKNACKTRVDAEMEAKNASINSRMTGQRA